MVGVYKGMADKVFADQYEAWLASLHPELAEAHAELHRFVHVLVSPGAKTKAEARLLAEFDALVLRLPWLIRQRRRDPAFAAMAAALRATVHGAPSPTFSTWELPDAVLTDAQSKCDACRHFARAAARQALTE